MMDSGTPSTTAPTTIPRAPPAPFRAELLLHEVFADDEGQGAEHRPQRGLHQLQHMGFRQQVAGHGSNQRPGPERGQCAHESLGHR